MMSLADIRQSFRGGIRLNEPLASYTSFGVGGACDYFFEPLSPGELPGLLRHLGARTMPFILVARGCNMLISDEGFRGAAICLERGCGGVHLRGGVDEERIVVAGAGARLARLIDFCVQNGIAGMEGFAGIPGTVGGAVTDPEDRSFLPLVEEVELVRGGEIMKIIGPGPGLTLRTGPEARDVILSVTIGLTAGKRDELLRGRRNALLRRNAERPLNMPKAGAAFRDPPGRRATDLLRDSGCAGMRSGGAVAAESHPNYIVTSGGSRAADVAALLRTMQARVRERTGVGLSLLARPVGFHGHFPEEAG